MQRADGCEVDTTFTAGVQVTNRETAKREPDSPLASINFTAYLLLHARVTPDWCQDKPEQEAQAVWA